jgi:hypothetical protein
MFHDSHIPRPEYPRPDRQRGLVEGVDWLNLNGPWSFRFDLGGRGESENWPDPHADPWYGQIIVPFCWESLAAWGEGDAAGSDHYYSTRCYLNPLEVTKENHRSVPRYEVGWYRREIKVPVDGPWDGKRVILTVGAADYFTDCWCNGVHMGRHEGGYLPFEFDLTDALTGPVEDGFRHAVLVIRVEDPMDHREQPVGKQWGWYTTTSGIWQTVFVEPRAPYHIESFRIFPDIDNGTVSFEVLLGGEGEGNLDVEIHSPHGGSSQIELRISGDRAEGEADIDPVLLWEPGDPRLYQVVFRLRDDSRVVGDEVRSYFGMRKISTEPVEDAPSMLCLNNNPIYLRGALYQSYHPEGVYTACDAETLKNDIIYALAVGFDFLRIHIKLDDPIFLYYADTLGILIMQDFPNFGEGGDTPTGRRRFEEMMRQGFKRDCNHPSIISWCIFNESWGFGGQNELMKLITPDLTHGNARGEGEPHTNYDSFKWIHQMWLLAKELDPTRLIEDMSVVVWEHLEAHGHVDTDINSWHFYINDYHKAKAHVEDVIAKTYHGSGYNYIEGYSQRDVPLINSEYGGVGALDGDQDISWTFKFLTNELRRHGQLSAYIFTQLMDVEWEKNGFMNYDRTPKHFGYPPWMINRGDVLPINAAPVSKNAPGDEVEVEVLASHFSRRKHEGVTFHWLYSGMDSLAGMHDSLARGHKAIPFKHYHVEVAGILRLKLPTDPMLCTLSVAAVTEGGETVASNYIQHFVSEGAVPPREERGRLLILRRRVTEWSDAKWSGGVGSREDAARLAACHGAGSGYFDWEFDIEPVEQLGEVTRLCILLEASSRRTDTPQTDSYKHASNFTLSVNGLPVLRNLLPDHPHDSRGALSFLRGTRGAYGYLIRSTIENDLLAEVIRRVMTDRKLRLRTAVSHSPVGGLTLYCHESGRYPVAPTVIIHRKA